MVITQDDVRKLEEAQEVIQRIRDNTILDLLVYEADDALEGVKRMKERAEKLQQQ